MAWFDKFLGGDDSDENSSPVSNKPASEEAISNFEQALKVKLPDALVRLYQEYDGIDEADARSSEVFRLMPLIEVLETNEVLREAGMGPYWHDYSMVCFWSDDNSNHAGIYCDGFLAGRVFFLDHDGPYSGDLSPVFRSVDSFQKHLREAAERNGIIESYESGELTKEELVAQVDRFAWYRHYAPYDTSSWHSLPVDYRCGDGEYLDEDSVAFRECQKGLEKLDIEDDNERDFLTQSLARLVPPGKLETLFSYLKEDHMWVPATVARILTLRKCDEAVPALVALALTGNPNCRESGKHSLAKIIFQTPESQQQVAAEYIKQGGDFSEIEANIQALKLSPTLFYQW